MISLIGAISNAIRRKIVLFIRFINQLFGGSMAINQVVAVLSADQTGVSNTTALTKVHLDTTLINDGSYFNTTNYEWMPPAGQVIITAQTFYELPNADGSDFHVRVTKNGAVVGGIGKVKTPGVSVSTTIHDTANGTDVYAMEVRGKGSSGTVTISGSTSQTVFSGTSFS